MPRKITSVDELQQIMWRFAEHRVVTVAARAGILGHLAEKETTIEETADALSLDPLATGKIIRALSALGILDYQGTSYRVVDALGPSFQAGPQDLVPFLAHSHDLYLRWGDNLDAWLRGVAWETQPRTKDGVRKFGEAMQAMGQQVAGQLVGELDLRGAKRLLDVGGGFGHYAKAFLEAGEALTATVLDTADVTEIAQEQVRGTPYEQRLDFQSGDYLKDPWGTGFDIVLLANVLHQELASAADEMVEHAAQALSPGGRLVVLDFSIDDEQREALLGTLFAINMRSFGDTYTARTIKGWMAEAGLVDIQRTAVSEFRWMIVGRKPL